jgi:hypothetical protein
MILIILVVVIIVMIAVYALTPLLFPASSSPWKTSANYPIQVADTAGVWAQQCVNSTAYVYCIGGQDFAYGPHNAVYTSSAISSSSGNITSWTLDSTVYPQTIYGQSCVASSGFVYCVGGTYDDSGDDVASSYYAPLNSNGVVGTWSSTTAFPVPVDGQYCVASSGYIYCVGGYDEANGKNATYYPSSSVEYAPLSSSGIGSWSNSTAYPANVYLPSCFAANGYIYCVGGVSNNNAVSTDYYASLSSSGVGAWTQTTPYPIAANGQACAISSGYIYCVGGEGSSSYFNTVYYATVSSGGIGTWTKADNYPQSTATDCVISSGYMYCVGGLGSSQLYDNAYYISLESLMAVTTTTSG